MNNSLMIVIGDYELMKTHYLWWLFLIPILIFLSYKFKNQLNKLKFSGQETEQVQLENKWINYVRWSSLGLDFFVLALIVIALARPYKWNDETNFDEQYKKGIDIILALDVSVSMLAKDFEPNRLEVSKRVAKEFVSNRIGDRIGLVAYEGEAFTACPSTLDYDILKAQIDLIQPGMMESGTAIGVGLGTAVTRLRDDKMKAKVIILLTDGVNNIGEISPEEAAQLAKEKNIKVYTIGVGSLGLAPSPILTPFGLEYQQMPVEIDEKVLQKIAKTTGGKYFRAKDEASLRTIYNEINVLEKRDFKDSRLKTEPPVNPTFFIVLAGLLFLINRLVSLVLFKKI